MRSVLVLLLVGSTVSAEEGPCQRFDAGACTVLRAKQMSGALGVTNVKDWRTTSGVASAYWHLSSASDGYGVFWGESRTDKFLIAVKLDTFKRTPKQGLTLYNAVDCVKFQRTVHTTNSQGFEVEVRLFEGVACPGGAQ